MNPSSRDLSQKRCLPCEKLGKPLTAEEIQSYLAAIPAWQLSNDSKSISRKFVMKNFAAALRLVNQIGLLAEAENHHPDIHLTGYRNLLIELSTHALGGLSQNDFVLAAKIDALPAELKEPKPNV